MEEQELQRLNAIRDRMRQGMSGYQAINYDALPKNQVSFEQYSNFINTQNDIEITGKWWKSFANGGISVINGMMGSARMLMDRRMSYEAQEGEAAGMAGVGSVAVDELARPITKLERYNVQANSTAEQVIYGLMEGGAQLAAQALVTMMTGGIGGGVFMGAQIAGNQYADLREKGVDAERAFTASVTNALIQTPMEQIALGKIMKAVPAGSGLRKKAMEMMESFLTEGFTEGLQSLPEQLTNIWAENNGIDALGVAREWDKNASENIKDMVFSGFIGAILGGGAKGLQIAINTGFEKTATKALTGTLESTAENIKKNKVENAQEKIDMLNQGQTVINLDAEQVMQYAYAQKANIEDVAKSLGTTKQDIEDAAAVGGDISVSFGHMASTMAQNESFGQAMKEHISFGDQGKSLNYFQLQKELEQTYGESSDRQQALKTELDAIEKSMVEAEIPADQIKKEIALANAFAISMSPDNPAAFLQKYQVRFEKGEDGTVNTLFQTAYHGTNRIFNKFTLDHLREGSGGLTHGYGLYFAKDENVANEYRNIITGGGAGMEFTFNGTRFRFDRETETFIGDNNHKIKSGEYTPESLLTEALIFTEDRNDAIAYLRDESDGSEVYQKAIQLAESGNINITKAGAIYKTSIPDDNVILDEDKVFSQQSEEVKDGLRKVFAEISAESVLEDIETKNSYGADIYVKLMQAIMNDNSEIDDNIDFIEENTNIARQTSELLNKNGIKGLHYWEKGDKDAFVVFDDKSIEIIDSYSQSSTENGSYFQKSSKQRRYVLSKGNHLDWGYVNELVADDGTKIEKAPIRIQIGAHSISSRNGTGFAHFNYKHKKQMKDFGYENVEDAVEDAINNASYITKTSDKRIEIVADKGDYGLLLAAELAVDNSTGEQFYDVITCYPITAKKVSEKSKNALSFAGGRNPADAPSSNVEARTELVSSRADTATASHKESAFGVYSLSEAKANVNKFVYKQELEQGTPKGAFTPQADGTYVISMFKGRDASTVIHETGHYFFEVFMQESGLDGADERLRKDREAFLNYVGMTDEEWRASDIEGRRKAHERVATAFEQYLLEGKAPSRSLRGVFERFSAWLKKIYGEVVKSDDYTELTDEVRDAFDHWLAADADIEEAMRTSGMYTKLDGKITSMLNDKQRAWLEDKIAGAREKAVQMITKEYMSNFSAKRREEITRFRADIEKEVKDQVHALKVNQARANVAEQFAIARQQTVQDGFESGRFARSTNKVIITYENANASNIAVKYNRTYGYQGMNPQERFNEINKDIGNILNPILEELREGIGRGQEYYWYDTVENKEVSDNTATEFINSEEEAIKAAKEKAAAEKKANPNGPVTPVPQKSKRYEKRSRSRNAQWYQNWYAKHGRQISDKELFNLAKELYYGKDDYGFYGDAFAKLPADVKSEIEAINRTRKQEIEELISLRDNYDASSKILERNKRFGLSDEQRLLFDAIAEDLGYSSGSEMAQDILNAKSEAKMIQEEMKRRVDEKFPDYATERELAEQAKIKALYDQDEGGMVAALEQQLIEEAAEEAVKRQVTMQERMAKAKEAKAQAEVAARNQLLKMKMKDALNARRLAMQERRAAANAKKAIKKGDLEAASEYKRQQMVLHAMVRHSLILKAEVAKAKKFAHKIANMKKDDKHFGNEKNFDQMMFFLYRLGVLRYDTQNAERRKKQLEHYNPADHTLPLEQYVAEMEDRLGEGMLEISKIVQMENVNISNSADMTIAEYQEIYDSLYNLYGIIQSEMKNTLDTKAKDFEEQTNNVVGHLNELPTKYTPSAGGIEKEDAIKRMIAQRQSLDNFLEMMDDWTFGYFSKTFGAPLKHAADLQAKLHMEWEDAMNAAMEKWCPTKEARRQADQENYYEELKANANKHTLINMLIQMGNESSMKRLCETRMVGCENSDLWVIAGENNNYTADEAIALTRNNLLEFLSQNLTKADVEFAQAKVDAVNKLWPLLSEVNKRTKGFAPRKVEATPVAFKPSDGDYMTFRGGYYPLARDGRMGSMRAGAEALADTENQYTQQHSMSTVQSTSKGRTDAKYPVALNYGYEFNMIEDTIHDIAYREVMMDFNKLLKNQKVYSTLKQKLGVENFNLLRETLWKCARPKSVQDSVMAERAFNSWASWIRGKIVNALIACNLKVSLQNIGNVFLYGNAVEGFTHADVFAALPNVFKGIEWHKAARNKVFELSPFMRERAKAPNFAMKEVAEENAAIKNFKSANGLTNADGAINKIKDSLDTLEEGTQKFGARLLEVTDDIIAIPVWLQAYNKQLQLGKSKQEAVDFADTVIRRTLGSNRLQDVSSMMRGGQMYKLFTAFQSFFNTQFNQWYREYKIDTKLFSKGEYKEAFMRVMSFVIAKWIFACIATTVIGTLSPTKPFEKDKKGWAGIYKELITYPIAVAGGPGGQIALEGVQALLGMQSYGYRLSVIENTIGKGISFMRKSNSVAQGKKDANELYEPAAEIIAIALGLPLQAIRTGGNLVNWVMGDMDLELEDLLNRRRKDERKKNR